MSAVFAKAALLTRQEKSLSSLTIISRPITKKAKKVSKNVVLLTFFFKLYVFYKFTPLQPGTPAGLNNAAYFDDASYRASALSHSAMISGITLYRSPTIA